MSAKTPTANASTAPGAMEIVVAHYPELLRFLERRVGRRDIAEDILQEVIAANLEKVGELRDPGAVLSWFYRTLRNAANDHHRRTKLVARAHDRIARVSDKVQAPVEAELANPCTCPTRVADELKPEYADALRSIEIEGSSLRSYAARRSISSGNAGVRVFRAREALRRALAFLCGSNAPHGCAACSCGTKADAQR